MEVTILAGKGGVGKSTISGACAINKSFYVSSPLKSEKVLIIDYDRGHSVTTVLADYEKREKPKDFTHRHFKHDLALKKYEPNKINNMNMKSQNLSIAILEDIDFIEFPKYISREGMGISGYLKQFTGDYGAVPYSDMMSTFFGTSEYPLDIAKFCSLVKIYNDALEQNFDRILIDIEPTGGLERLLNQANRISIGRKNLMDSRFATVRELFSKWPHPRAYLGGEYMQNIEHYTQRINNLVDGLKSAKYFIVTNPKVGPVNQINTIERIIEDHEGKVFGYVINTIEGRPYESNQIKQVKNISSGKHVVEIEYNTKLCSVIDDENITIDDTYVNLRRWSLYDVGKKFSGLLTKQNL